MVHVLGCTSLSSGRAQYMNTTASPLLRILLNVYDGTQRTLRQTRYHVAHNLNVLNVTAIAGAKPLAWRMLLSAAQIDHWSDVTQLQFEYVWLFDEDMNVASFDVQAFFSIAALYKPIISQPRISPHKPGGRSTDYHKLRYTSKQTPVFVPLCFVETQSPVVAAFAWKRTLHPALVRLPVFSLKRSTGGMSHYWCGLMSRAYANATGSVCGIINVPLIHMDTRTIMRSDSHMVRAVSPEGRRFRTIISRTWNASPCSI